MENDGIDFAAERIKSFYATSYTPDEERIFWKKLVLEHPLHYVEAETYGQNAEEGTRESLKIWIIGAITIIAAICLIVIIGLVADFDSPL